MDDIRLALVFVPIADHLHIGRAAERLGLTRDAAASRLRALERAFGIRLLDRSHRCRIALTPEGAAVLPAARAMLAAHDALTRTAVEVREGRRGVVRVAIVGSPAATPRGHGAFAIEGARAPEPAGDDRLPEAAQLESGGRQPTLDLRALGRVAEALAGVLDGLEDGWAVDLRRMDRHGASRAMEIGEIDCAIECGGPLRLGPGALDPRPHGLERARSITVRPSAGPRTTLTWRASWGVGSTLGDERAARVRDRLVATARGLAQEAIDERRPGAAARRRAVEERRRLVDERRERFADETRRFGREVALRRAHEEERRETIQRFEAARAAGTVTPNLLVDWMCATMAPGTAPADDVPGPG